MAASLRINFPPSGTGSADKTPLNELADRLAVIAPRNRAVAVDEVTGARIAAAVEDAKIICAAL